MVRAHAGPPKWLIKYQPFFFGFLGREFLFKLAYAKPCFMKNFNYLVFFCLLISHSVFSQINIYDFKTENLKEPNAIDVPNPRFSWKVNSSSKNDSQSAYQIILKTGKKVVWDSKKVPSSQSLFVNYSGPALESNTHYFVELKVWSKDDQVSNTFQSQFSTGFLRISDWKSKWISSGLSSDTTNGNVPVLSKEFYLKSTIKTARLYITSYGLYEAEMNHQRIGEAYLSPGWTSYDHHLQYQVYDLSDLLKKGENLLEVKLGSGWFRTKIGWQSNKNYYGSETALLAQLEVEYKNGKKEIIVSDESWEARNSSILLSEIYDGENQDTRIIHSEKSPVKLVEKSFSNLVSSINEPITKNIILPAKKFILSEKKVKIIDFGQNFVGWAKLKIKGRAGQKITLRHVEMLDKFGEPYYENLRSAKATATYILNGEEQILEPHFTFFGFRYLIVEGLEEVDLNNFEGVALYSNMEETGFMETDNDLINQLLSNIKWGQRGNFLDVPTDCPQRDERLGWTGDAEVFSRTAAFNYQVNSFFSKWLKDVAYDQFENGAVPFVIPDVLNKRDPRPVKGVGAAGWSDASIIIPYNIYTTYSDKDLLARQYPSMKKYLNYMIEASNDFLWNEGFQFADWLSYRVDDSKRTIGQLSAVTDNYLVAQAFFAFNLNLMIKTAKILDKKEDEKAFKGYLMKVKEQFQKEFMTPSGRLVSDTQTAYLLALAFDLIPENIRQKAVERLVKNIESYKYHLTTGFLGTPYLNPILTKFNHFEIADKLLMQDTYPSWLYPIKAHGATTIWERWDSMKPDSTFQDPGMTSFNHYAYGAIGDWIYRNIGGIDTEEFDGAGYKISKIHIHVGTIKKAKTRFKSPYGLISTDWEVKDKEMFLSIKIPFNTNSKVFIPNGFNEAYIENKKVDELLRDSEGNYFILGSGDYQIVFK